jgi:hypothetical protein
MGVLAKIVKNSMEGDQQSDSELRMKREAHTSVDSSDSPYPIQDWIQLRPTVLLNHQARCL